jgi:nitrite reductase/ring-hydroxylating ferredoxin subunit
LCQERKPVETNLAFIRVISYIFVFMKFRGILSVRWHWLMREADLAEGKIRERQVLGRLVGAVKVDGNIYVFDGRCPHAGRSLHDGEVSSSGIVECPGHGLRYSLTTQPCWANVMPLSHVAFRIHDGAIEIDLQALRAKQPR